MFKEKWLIFRRPPESPGKGEKKIAKSSVSKIEGGPTVGKMYRKALSADPAHVLTKSEKLKDDYFKVYPGGKFSDADRKLRTENLSEGITIFRDVGLVFYKVVAGDTIGGIKEKLGKLSKFAYLKTLSDVKIRSFNIPPKLLQLGMWIPLPSPPDTKENLSDVAFIKYCDQAINDLKKNKIYGSKMTAFEFAAGKGAIILAMTTIAKAESGGKLGKFADRRYENGHKAFSYTIFHILMDDAGLKARRNLNMTVGQTLHPKNSVKLFLAFLFEKAGKTDVARYFPLNKHFEDFATFYNGNWQARKAKYPKEPSYPEKLKKYYPVPKKPMAKS